MDYKGLALENAWDNIQKVMYCNLLTGEIVNVKNTPEEEQNGCTSSNTLKEYTRSFIATGMLHKMDVESYLHHFDLEYIKTEICRKNYRMVYSCRQRSSYGYGWFTYEFILPQSKPTEAPWVLILGKIADSDTCVMLDAMRMLSGIYHKILRIDLIKDTYEIIKIYQEEQNPEYGICTNFSEWFRNFAKRGYVHEDDLEAYLLFTEIGAMRERFKKCHKKQSLRYRRLINNEFHWVSMELMPSACYTKEHQEIMLFIRDLEDYNN